MSTHTPVVQTDNLTKVYGGGRGRVKALDSLTLQVQQGEIFGYLGPNGAGKTTTIRLLLDFIRPTAGHARLFGLDAQRDSVAIRQRIGYMPAELNLWGNLSALEVIRFFGHARGGVDMVYVRELADRLEFDLTKKIRQYSTGNKRKIGLILAMMNRPDLLILDEPSSGLDPLMQQLFIQMLREARAEGRTIFLSSHVLSEVQAVCDRVGILRDGRLQMVDRIDALTKVDFRWVTLKLKQPIPASAFEHLPGVEAAEVTEAASIRLRLHGDFDPLLRALEDQYVIDLRTEEPTLEEAFLAYYGDLPAVNGARRATTTEKEMVR